MTPNQEGDLKTRSDRPNTWRLFAAPALAALFAFGVALALPTAPANSPPEVAACAGAEVALPPGHPPIGGRAMAPRGLEAQLPPGHPPIGGRPQRAAPLQAPTFAQPEILDI
jgi:hypothetical protein